MDKDEKIENKNFIKNRRTSEEVFPMRIFFI